MGFCEPNEYLLFMRQTPNWNVCSSPAAPPLQILVPYPAKNNCAASSPAATTPETLETLPVDIQSLDRWDDYTGKLKTPCSSTPTPATRLGHHPFRRQKRARLNCIRYFLHQLDYPGKT